MKDDVIKNTLLIESVLLLLNFLFLPWMKSLAFITDNFDTEKTELSTILFIVQDETAGLSGGTKLFILILLILIPLLCIKVLFSALTGELYTENCISSGIYGLIIFLIPILIVYCIEHSLDDFSGLSTLSYEQLNGYYITIIGGIAIIISSICGYNTNLKRYQPRD